VGVTYARVVGGAVDTSAGCVAADSGESPHAASRRQDEARRMIARLRTGAFSQPSGTQQRSWRKIPFRCAPAPMLRTGQQLPFTT
jgi:hypothetical protein